MEEVLRIVKSGNIYLPVNRLSIYYMKRVRFRADFECQPLQKG